MKSKVIKINNITDINNFVKEASKLDGNVFVIRDEYTVDGKSIMGLISIDVSKPCEVMYPTEAINFEKFLSQFED